MNNMNNFNNNFNSNMNAGGSEDMSFFTSPYGSVNAVGRFVDVDFINSVAGVKLLFVKNRFSQMPHNLNNSNSMVKCQ